MESSLRPRVLALAAILAGLIVSILWTAAGSAQPTVPIRVDARELEAHRLSGELRMRHPEARNLQLFFEVIIDESGAVAEVRPADEDRRLPPEYRIQPWLPAVRDLVETWRFRPFTRDGRAVPARAEVSVAVLPPERRPTVHVPFPGVPMDEIEIGLTRTGCFGTCPSYSVTIHGDGRVRFIGEADTVVNGAHDYRISTDDVARLVEQFRAGDFWSLEDVYEASVTDNPTYVLTVRAGNRTKRVSDYVGLEVGMPDIVRRLEDAVDATADTARWVRGNERTLESLEANGFDFRSRSAAEAVIASLGDAPESLPLGLIDRGAPLGLTPRCEGCRQRTYEGAALARAVQTRRVAIFDRLDRNGAVARLSQSEKDELLMAAASVRSVALVERLLARGASSRARSAERGSALIQALDNSYFEPPPTLEEQEAVVRILLASGSDLRARDRIQWTALQHAYHAQPRIVSMLIQAGADVDAHHPDTEPLLYITDDEEIALIALAAGADRRLRNNRGETLAQIARNKGWRRVQALLAADR